MASDTGARVANNGTNGLLNQEIGTDGLKNPGSGSGLY